MTRLRAALRSFVLWLLPIYALVFDLVGTDDDVLMWILGGVALLVFVVIMYSDRLAAYRTGVRRYFKATSALGHRLEDLEDAMKTHRAEQHTELASLEASLTRGLGELTDAVHRANDLAGYSAQRVLGARALYLDRMRRPVYFIHSHRPEIPKHDHRTDPHAVNYTVPAVPVDEAPFISLTSLWVSNARPSLTVAKTEETRIVCGCRIHDRDDAVLKESLVLIGSTLYNPATTFLEEEAIKRNWLHYRFGHETIRADPTNPGHATAAIFGVPGSPRGQKAFRPDPELPAPPKGTRLKDYGLVTRMRNPIGPGKDGSPSFVVIVAGCLLAGQLALTDWLARPETLHRLSVEHEDRPFQYVICVEYEYENAWNPHLDYGSVEIADQTELQTAL